jgi:hypothetical protein
MSSSTETAIEKLNAEIQKPLSGGFAAQMLKCVLRFWTPHWPRKSTQGCVKALMRRQGGQSSSRRSLQTATIANGRVLL